MSQAYGGFKKKTMIILIHEKSDLFKSHKLQNTNTCAQLSPSLWASSNIIIVTRNPKTRQHRFVSGISHQSVRFHFCSKANTAMTFSNAAARTMIESYKDNNAITMLTDYNCRAPHHGTFCMITAFHFIKHKHIETNLAKPDADCTLCEYHKEQPVIAGRNVHHRTVLVSHLQELWPTNGKIHFFFIPWIVKLKVPRQDNDALTSETNINFVIFTHILWHRLNSNFTDISGKRYKRSISQNFHWLHLI